MARHSSSDRRRILLTLWRQDEDYYQQTLGGLPGAVKRSRPTPTVKASPVTVTRPDGTTEVRPAYTAQQARRIAPERPPISRSMRERIMKRDGYACRYCGNEKGPFHLDHVLPVIQGGATTMRNLVTACEPCNLRKGAEVWKPNPLPRRPRGAA